MTTRTPTAPITSPVPVGAGAPTAMSTGSLHPLRTTHRPAWAMPESWLRPEVIRAHMTADRRVSLRRVASTLAIAVAVSLGMGVLAVVGIAVRAILGHPSLTVLPLPTTIVDKALVPQPIGYWNAVWSQFWLSNLKTLAVCAALPTLMVVFGWGGGRVTGGPDASRLLAAGLMPVRSGQSG